MVMVRNITLNRSPYYIRGAAYYWCFVPCDLYYVALQACDDLDFVAMDDFQKRFFLLRQDEWATYKEQVPG